MLELPRSVDTPMPRPRINLRQLHYFIAVAEAGSISKAAVNLNLSQPPLTLQMQRLEAEIGVALLLRHKKGIELTTAGTVLAREARSILARVSNSIEQIRQLGRGEIGELRIGLAGAIMWSDFSAIFNRFRSHYPGLKCTLRELPAAPLIAALNDRIIDVGFLRTPVRPGVGISCVRVALESIAAAVPAGHALTKVRKLRLVDLANEPLVLLDPNATVFAGLLVKACRNAGFEPQVVLSAKDAITVLGLVANEQGISLLPESLQRISWPGVNFVPILDPALPADLFMVSRSKDPSGAVVNFVELARQHAPKADRRKAGSPPHQC